MCGNATIVVAALIVRRRDSSLPEGNACRALLTPIGVAMAGADVFDPFKD
jgi:hypothetical protein